MEREIFTEHQHYVTAGCFLLVESVAFLNSRNRNGNSDASGGDASGLRR